jgi:hypothetical protein
MTALDMVRKEHPDAVSEAVSTVLPQWLATFHAILSTLPSADVADPNNWDAISIRIQIFRTLDVLQTSFAMTPEVTGGFCNIMVQNLNNLMPAFRTYYLLGGANSEKGGLEPPTPVSADDPDINLSLMHLACPAMDFLGEVIRKSVRKTKVAADWVTANIGTVMSLALYWAQIPVEDVRKVYDRFHTITSYLPYQRITHAKFFSRRTSGRRMQMPLFVMKAKVWKLTRLG